MKELRRLFRYLKPHLWNFTFATFAMLAVGILQSAIGALIVPIFDQAFASGGKTAHQTSTLYGLQKLIPTSGIGAWRNIALLLILFTIAKGIAEYLSTYLMARVGQESVLHLRRDLYRHLLTQSAAFFERHRTNYLVSRLVSSAAAIETAVTSTVRDMLREGFTLVAFLSASIYYSWRLTLSVLIIAPIIAMLTARFSKRLRNLARESLEGNQRLVDISQEALANQQVVKAYRGEQREEKRFTKVAMEIVRANLRAAKINGFAPPTIELIGVLAVVGLLFIGQREIVSGRMNAAQFITFLFFLFSSYDPMRKLSRLHSNMETAFAATHHIWEVFDDVAATPEKKNALWLTTLKKALEFQQVSFNYLTQERGILKNIDLNLPAGWMVAIVGESGSGKSTLTKLLLRLHDPTSGRILWDGIDIRDVKLTSLREKIALVTQETVLFNDTVRYNISYGKPDASDDDIKIAARTAHAHDFITALPNGYDTIIGERGLFLSGGQRQRLAIARATLIDAPFLILDEATSALDADSERLVQQALSNLTKDRTTLVIAHRLSTVRRANIIVVLDQGRIIEIGTHQELLNQNGQYRRLYELQFAEEELVNLPL